MTRTAVANEPFTAATDTTIVSLTGWTGVQYNAGYCVVTSNKADLKFAPGNAFPQVFRQTGTYSSDDQYALVTIGGSFDILDTFAGLIVRASGTDATSTYYEMEFQGGSGAPYTTTIRKVVNQTPTTLGSTFTVSWVAGDIMALEVSGTTLTAYQNASVLTTRTDVTVTTGTPGFSMRGVNAHAATFDDWEGGTLSASGPVTVAASGSAMTGGSGTQAPVISIGL